MTEPLVSTQQAFKVLYRFQGHLDGARPQAELVEANGKFYGTTTEGGSNARQCFCGTVFSVDGSGNETVLYRFQGGNDGATPEGSLLYLNGTFYGTTFAGGNSNYCGGGCGTLFALDASGQEQVVHRFGGGNDGVRPSGRLVAYNGKIFGTTQGGGTFSCGCGTVFAFDPSTGQETPVYAFTGGNDGSVPLVGLTQIGKNLYGTTSGGGDPCGPGSCGSVFSINSSGSLRVVHTFTIRDGNYPSSNVVQVGTTLYGTTYDGGDGCVINGCGTIYAIDKSGNERIVWLFGVDRDGEKPAGHLAVYNGTIYGTTEAGGNTTLCFGGRTLGCGTIFRFKPSIHLETKLHAFSGPDGESPLGGVIERGGLLYGTAYTGAIRSWGNVFLIGAK